MLKVLSSKFQARHNGQVMLLTVLVISGTLMSISLIAGLLMLYQIRQAGDFTNSAKSIFAADSGVEWWFYNEKGLNPRVPSSSVTFSNGQSFEVVDLGGGRAKVIGTAGNSRRAFLIESIPIPPGPIPCNQPIDLMILVKNSIDQPIFQNVKNAIKNFLDKLGVSPGNAHVGFILFGQDYTPFSSTHLTDDLTIAKSNVDSMTAILGNDSYLSAAISSAACELDENIPPAGCGDTHDRPDLQAPDYIIIITDDIPNTPLSDPLGAAETAAINAKSQSNIELFAAYGGADSAAVDFYTLRVVSTPSDNHFYQTYNFDSASNIPLNDMLICR